MATSSSTATLSPPPSTTSPPPSSSSLAQHQLPSAGGVAAAPSTSSSSSQSGIPSHLHHQHHHHHHPAAPPSFSSSLSSSNSASNSAPVTGPPSVRSTAGSPRPKFDTDALSSFLKTHLASKLSTGSITWTRDKDRNKQVTAELAQSAKAKMLELAPKGFKFVVQVQLVENLGQGGRGDMACHWEETDQVVQELFSNDRILCTITCFAIRAF
ncbi:hypothetical protein OC846_001489 [Tilletia horrida]|uniref:Topoisomerase I damage affected protein 2 n=1 Tax=Tilletia horrida TaxID=155126 RepID=A0AAN6GV49_9BASI|nr:hypothetical protein OC845_001450 [Tilletia horrida]KAK0555937.1 hypothetical protein OC846_001489 [Tilletia horrida]